MSPLARIVTRASTADTVLTTPAQDSTPYSTEQYRTGQCMHAAMHSGEHLLCLASVKTALLFVLRAITHCLSETFGGHFFPQTSGTLHDTTLHYVCTYLYP